MKHIDTPASSSADLANAPGIPELLTVSEVARRLSLSESHLRHLVMRGDFPGVIRIGRAVRIDASAVRRFLGQRLDHSGAPG